MRIHYHTTKQATMALTKVNSAVSALVEEVSMTTVDKVVEFLKSKIDFDEDFEGFFKEFKETLKADMKAAAKKSGKKSSDGEPKKKRAPSAYNLYIKDKMAEIKVSNPEIKGKDLMKAAIDEWKKTNPKKTEKSDEE